MYGIFLYLRGISGKPESPEKWWKGTDRFSGSGHCSDRFPELPCSGTCEADAHQSADRTLYRFHSHGTAGAFGPVLEDFGVAGASTLCTAGATFGLIAGSMMGGPIGKRLIEKKNLLDTVVQEDDSLLVEEEKKHVRHTSMYPAAVFQLIIAIGIGTIVSDLLSKTGMTFPIYIGAMIAAASVFCSQNLGAKQPEWIRKGLRQAVTIGVAYGALIGLVLIFGGRTLTLIFVNKSAVDVLDASAKYLRYLGFFFWSLGILNVNRMVTQGLGYSGRAVFSGVTEMIAHVIVSVGFVGTYGFTAICCADQAAWISASCYILPTCLMCVRRATEKMK